MLTYLYFIIVNLIGSDKFYTVNELNVTNYLGKWDQVYGSPFNYVFQGYGDCIKADYGLLKDGNISIINTQRNINNEFEKITGYGYYKNISDPGKLTINLEGVPFDAPYWVIKLGEVMNNQYQYSVVTSPFGVTLWVLARDVDVFKEKYEQEVVEFLEEQNFWYEEISQENCTIKTF